METLKKGSTGPDVELLQAGLKRAGYYRYSIDGIFGELTDISVENFQRSFGLIADGVVGPKTWAALRPFLVGYYEYTVKAGDTYYRLAGQFGTTVASITAANPSVNPGTLRIGQVITVPYGFPAVFTNISFTYTVLQLGVEGLHKRYPFLEVSVIGTTAYGGELYAVKIGRGSREVMYNASHHANEWITSPLLMEFLENYASAYVNGGSLAGYMASEIYDTATIYIVPMVNPEGVDLVTGVIKPGSGEYEAAARLAANYPNIPFPDGWKANLSGTDINLNYPAGWENAKKIKYAQGFTKPSPRDFVGTAPLSAPEAAAMAEFTNDHDFALTLSYHTQGEVIYWKYLNYQPEGSIELARLFAKISGYAYEETPYESGFAGYKDWFIQTYNRPGFTIEVGQGENPLPITQLPRIYSENLGIFVAAAIAD